MADTSKVFFTADPQGSITIESPGPGSILFTNTDNGNEFFARSINNGNFAVTTTFFGPHEMLLKTGSQGVEFMGPVISAGIDLNAAIEALQAEVEALKAVPSMAR